MKFKKILCLSLSVLMVSTTIIPAYAYGNTIDQLTSNSNIILLSPEKEEKLLEIAREANLNIQEINQLRELYKINRISDRGKIGIILKIAKVSKNIMIKASKTFGVKMVEKSAADWLDYLFEWQDDLQNGIENFLIDKCNWNSTTAHWTAKTIMFIIA